MQSFSTYLNFLISLVFIIALCSVILSIIYEAIAYYMKSRGDFLKNALEQVLNDTVHEGQLNLTELFYAHPQIDLTKKTYRHLPAYISSQNFAQTLVDALCNKHIRDNLSITSNPLESATIKDPLALKVDNKLQLFNAAVENFGYCDLQILLNGFISNADGSLDKLYRNITQWYEEYMNRVSGWYKIKVQKNLFMLAVIVCIAMNMDFFKISLSLMNDKNLTEHIAKIAETYNPPAKIDSITNAADLQKAIELKNNIVDTLYKLNAPILWQNESLASIKKNWFFKLVGWLIMAVALSFGSPFWFELLNKLVNIRKTGIKPALLSMPGNDEKTNQ